MLLASDSSPCVRPKCITSFDVHKTSLSYVTRKSVKSLFDLLKPRKCSSVGACGTCASIRIVAAVSQESVS
jgi:hypothetical protein